MFYSPAREDKTWRSWLFNDGGIASFQARTTPARGGSGRAVGGTNAAPKVVTVVPSSVSGAMPPVGCPAMGTPQPPPQMMGGPGGMVISGGVPQPGPLWGAPRPQTQPGGNVPIINNGGMMTPMTSLPVPTQMISQITNPCGPPQQQQPQAQRVMAGPPQNVPSHLPLNPHHQQQQQSGIPPMITQAMSQPPPPQHQQQPPPQQLVPTIPVPPDPSLGKFYHSLKLCYSQTQISTPISMWIIPFRSVSHSYSVIKLSPC